MMIESSTKMGIPEFFRPEDILTGNEKVNTLFLFYIFNINHGLKDLTKEEFDPECLIDDDVEGTLEER